MDATAPVRLDVVVGLGSNLEDRCGHLLAGLSALSELGRLTATSSLYETAPVGGPPQPAYLNAAVRLETELSPLDLLGRLQIIEATRGRVRLERWGPRTLDLDLLWAKGLVLVGSLLTVPHPRLKARAFALVPLLEVAPDAVDPVDGIAYADRLALLDRAGITRVGSLEQPEPPRTEDPTQSAACLRGREAL